jgi:glyoxylase-like metal-dependent hydrolase (beta-lactamase superfamily II)
VELLQRAIGPLATNVYVLGDEATREAVAVDTAIPCVEWVAGALLQRGWRLRLIVSTHGHWDHIGDNAALQRWSADVAAHLADHAAAEIAVHPLDRERLVNPQPLFAPFEIPPSVPAVDLAEGGVIRFGEVQLEVMHTPGHTEGSVCLRVAGTNILLSGDTLFPGGWGRVDLPGGSPDQMVDSIRRLRGLADDVRVLPGHGAATNIGRERPWMDLVAEGGWLLT